MVLAGALAAAGLVNLPPNGSPWDCTVGMMPTDVQQNVVVFNTTAVQDGRLMRTGQKIDHPGASIQIAAKTQEQGYAKAWEICAFLDKLHNQDVVTPGGSARICAISRKGRPIYVGLIPGGRFTLHTINLTMTISEP